MDMNRFWGRSRAPRESLAGASVIDLAGAFALTAFALATVIGSGHSLALAPAVALATFPVAWRRRAPLGYTIARRWHRAQRASDAERSSLRCSYSRRIAYRVFGRVPL